VYGRVFGFGEFKYTNRNFKGAEGVVIATKFRQKKANAIRIFQGANGVGMATNCRQNKTKIATN